MKADAVFEGGGVRGIAFTGAVEAMEEYGYEWERLAGTSAGAVIAALLASGYTGAEMKNILASIEYSEFLGKTILNRIPFVGSGLELFIHLGLYHSDNLERWLEGLLEKKGIRTFADLPEGKLKIIASDISNGRLLILPDHLEQYNLEPKDLKVATAVKMSASIPFFFRPVIWKSKRKRTSYIVDGGLLSNFPIWIFDKESPRWPTFGFRFVKEEIDSEGVKINNPVDLFKSMFKTMLQAHDLRYINERTKERTVRIYTDGITATEFDLTADQIEFLYNSGYHAAQTFLSGWDFETHKAKRMQLKHIET
ncbi:patatin-like phospholipase family protein [Pseudalkalibacillus caeni]|uniref:Phospholipase n=1 Tax=Exobacillus caeni TaxID=2574798 RepID=A0A5R9F089_9BACL|nr:patatin-like phospholipase family protein [Pseudalkalibacillus caeni]TLS36109.1 phospholipase [Pseudalkalibacillus caeni]